MSIIGFLGSSRPHGETAALANAVFSHLGDATLIDLNTLHIGPYSYDNAHADDDFYPLAEAMAAARVIVFASPVYWYSMSAQMKTLFDRMTDMTRFYKPLGKSLAGKTMFTIGTGSTAAAPDSFTRPFSDTAGYFGMDWGGLLFAAGAESLTPETEEAAKAFAEKIRAAAG